MTGRGRLTRREFAALTAAAWVAWVGRRARAQDPPPPKDPPASPPDGASPAKPPSPVDLALDWLVRHQRTDGRWSAAFGANCADPPCGGEGAAVVSGGTTALGLLAFLAQGETHQSGDHKAQVRDAAKFIRSLRNEDGCLGVRGAERWFEAHVAATAAFVDLHGLSQSKLFRETAEMGLRFAASRRRDDGGWSPGDGDSTSEATAQVAGLLRGAELAGLPVDTDARRSALDYVKRATDPKTHALRPAAPGPGEKPAASGPEDPGLTALSALTRIWAADDDAAARKDPVVPKVADRLAKSPPSAGTTADAPGLVAWERQAALFEQTQGASHTAWCKELRAVLRGLQRMDGCAKGSWDVLGPGLGDGGRLAATSSAILALSAPYRFASRLVAKPAAPPAPPGPGAPPPK